MEKEKKKSGVTIAELIVILAFAVFAVFTCVGLLLGNSLTWAILLAVVYCLAPLLLLLFMIKAKKTENDFKKWRAVEIVCLLVFIGSFYFLSRPMQRSIAATMNKTQLIQYGKDDIKAIENFFASYESTESTNISQVKASLRLLEGARVSDRVRSLLSETKGRQTIAQYCDQTLTAKYLGADGETFLNYADFKTGELSYLNELESDLENWNMFRIPGIAHDLEVECSIIAERLTEISSQLQPNTDNYYKYVFTLDSSNSTYVLRTDKTKAMLVDYNGRKPMLKLKGSIQETSSPLSEVVVWILCLLMLTSYFACLRSTTVEIRRSKGLFSKSSKEDEDDEGIDLYD